MVKMEDQLVLTAVGICGRDLIATLNGETLIEGIDYRRDDHKFYFSPHIDRFSNISIIRKNH